VFSKEINVKLDLRVTIHILFDNGLFASVINSPYLKRNFKSVGPEPQYFGKHNLHTHKTHTAMKLNIVKYSYGPVNTTSLITEYEETHWFWNIY